MQSMRQKHFHTFLTVSPSFRHLLKRLDSKSHIKLPDNVCLRLFAMSLSSFSSLSSYSSDSESDISTLFDFNLSKPSSSRPHAHARRRSPEPPRIKYRRPSPSPPSRHTHTRAKRRSITPTRTPVSSSKYDNGARALVPSSFHSPGSKSGISYNDINRWRAGTIGGSEFTYSSESSVTVSSVTSPSYVSSVSRTRIRYSHFDSSSRRSTTSGHKRLKAPSIASQHSHPANHHDPSQICEHCRTAQYILFLLSHR